MSADICALPPKMQTKIRFEICLTPGLDLTCWIWTGASNGKNYGSVGHEGRSVSTHRLSYQLLVGPIPDGLQLDHLCRVTRCCNPAHLEPVTPKVNSQRSAPATKRHCVNGHALVAPNLIIKYRRTGLTERNCRVCAMDYHRGRRRQDDGPLRKKQPAAVRRRQEILVAAEAALQQVA